MTAQYPKDFLRAQFVGKSLNDASIVTPAVVLDVAKIEINCNRMLEASEKLQLSWRAHVKTHKVPLAKTHLNPSKLKLQI